ncbi:MAG TPA: hypothetical protein VEF35_05600 [Candidatus Bathyarchaeia archaeon]|nr:hypothetical protein [Candidatus Bathyarchaeia archaeon]
MTVPFEPVYAGANPERKTPTGGCRTHAYRFGAGTFSASEVVVCTCTNFRTIRPDIQGGDEPGCIVLLLEDVDMGQRRVFFCIETPELLADGLKCGRVRPSFLVAASAFESIF